MNVERLVMARLDPTIYDFATGCVERTKLVDHRVKPGNDDWSGGSRR
jgi:hypothetical protein